MGWSAQSPDIYLIENLWTDIKKVVAEQKPVNSRDLCQAVKEAWEGIQLKRCQDLIDSDFIDFIETEAIQRNSNYFINL